MANIYGIFPSGFRESITGTDEDDTIYPLGGWDTVDGRSGFDEVVIQGPSTAFKLTFAEGSTYIDSISGASANADQVVLRNVESLRFTDKIVSLQVNDTFTAQPGADFLDGGPGTDTVAYARPRADHKVTLEGGKWVVRDQVGDGGKDVLTSVERLKFSDGALALDLDGAAGQVARILGALFGKSALSNTVYAGIGLSLLDGGTSYPDLIGLALGTDLFKSLAGAGSGAVTNRQFVNLVYQNVIGSAPSAADLAYYVGQLDSGNFTQTTLARLACDLDLTAKLVNLVGLADTGLAYAPFNVGGA